MKSKSYNIQSFERLLHIMDDLREKCPWDKKQTIQSLRYLTIEEVYELGEAILDEDFEEIKKELGDLLLHIVFYSKIAYEKGLFDISDVCHSICDKLVERHPHVYGSLKVEDDIEVKKNWEIIKINQGNKSVLGGVPRSLPAMLKAYRMQEKVSAVGFDWENTSQVFEKVKEELEEFEAETQSNSKEKMEQEFGDILFSLINYARVLNINPESALENTNRKFINRFQYIEDKISVPINEVSPSEMNRLWEQAKNDFYN